VVASLTATRAVLLNHLRRVVDICMYPSPSSIHCNLVRLLLIWEGNRGPDRK